MDGPAAREELVQALFESSDAETLAAAIVQARAGGVPEQAILEARFLFLVDQGDFAAVGELAPVLAKQKAAFRIADSVIFSVPEEFFGIIEYCHALAALAKDDQAAFKKHITEAFWLSPRQAAAFAPHIEEIRQAAAMEKLVVDLTQSFALLSDGTKKSLAGLAGKSEHLLVHFWSPWSNECEAFLPDFIATAQELTRHNIAVVSLLVEPNADALAAAREFRAAIKEENLGEWIVDNPAAPLSRTLRVQDLPAVALLTAKGRVLFSGHPADDSLWDALHKVVPTIERPRLAPPAPPGPGAPAP